MHEFDTLSYNSQTSVYFKYPNLSDNQLIIEDILTNCGCTVGKWNPNSTQTNQLDSIEIIFEAEEKGYFIREITVVSNSKTSPDRLYIKGYVD